MSRRGGDGMEQILSADTYLGIIALILLSGIWNVPFSRRDLSDSLPQRMPHTPCWHAASIVFF